MMMWSSWLLSFALLQMDQGQRAYHVQDWPSAERHFVEALRKTPASAAAQKWLGMTYAAQQKAALAEAPLRRACDLDPNEPEACYYLGRTLFALGRFGEAVAAYQRAQVASRHPCQVSRLGPGTGAGTARLGCEAALEEPAMDQRADQGARGSSSSRPLR